MKNFSSFLASQANQPYFYVLLLADLVLRGLALYRSARKDQKIWFVALLLVNSLGILPLIYLLLNRGKTTAKAAAKKTTKRTKK